VSICCVKELPELPQHLNVFVFTGPCRTHFHNRYTRIFEAFRPLLSGRTKNSSPL
jgi:hypothetical protein